MHRRRLLLILTIISFLSLTLSISASSPKALAASAPTQPKTFTVLVSRNGFNGTAGTFTITVQQGDVVNITFVYDDNDLSVDNPHAVAFEGYGIQTISVGKSNPTVTVEFVANVAGTFSFYCYIPCVGMGNMLGHLIVTPTQGTRTPTTLALAVSGADPSAGSFLISATVKDLGGKPVVGMPVKFYENTVFGRLLLSTVPTNSFGVAGLNYTTTRVGSIQIIAENQGDVDFGNSNDSIFLTVPRMTTGQIDSRIYVGLISPGPAPSTYYGIPYPQNFSMIGVPRIVNILLVTLGALVVLSVWSTYAYVFRQVAGLPRHTERRYEQFEAGVPIIPEIVGGIVAPEVTSVRGKTLALLLTTPLLGVADMFVVDSLGLPLLLRVILLIGLALSESLAMVMVATSQNNAE